MEQRPVRKNKLSVRQVILMPGESVFGEYLGRAESVNEATGEIIEYVEFKPLDSGEKFRVRTNMGLDRAMRDAFVKENMRLELTRLEDALTKAGNAFAQYEIYEVE